MKHLEGIDLSTELKAASDELFQKEKESLRRRLVNTIGKHNQAKGSVTRLREELRKAEEAAEKYAKQLREIEAGNWNAVPEEKEEKQAVQDGNQK